MSTAKTKKRSTSRREGFVYTLEPKKTKILILGTFPSERALNKAENIGKKHFYYSTSGNSFWKIIHECIKTNVSENEFLNLCYDRKIEILSKNSICLWDLVKNCEREGGSNRGIKESSINDLSAFLKNGAKIIVNGLNAYCDIKNSVIEEKERRILLKQLGDAEFLPQTSSRNSNLYPIDRKKRWWKNAINKCKRS